ncbi:MAG: hypothetical protein RIM72_10005 [Alphaproteobacteria bacterium]
MSDARPVVFMHMMKTGGLTMVNVLREAYGVDRTFKLGNTRGNEFTYIRDLEDAAENPDIQVFIGHFGWGVGRLFDRPVRYLTILRHPVDRVLSLYQYSSSEPCSVDGLMRFVAATPEARNGVVRRLNGLATADFGANDYRAIDWRAMLPADIGIELSNDHLAAATDNLGRFTAVGLQERYPETLLLFRDRLDSPPLFNIRRPFLNNSAVALTRQDIDPMVAEAILDHNRLDLALYEKAEAAFRQHVGDLQNRRPVEMAVQRLLNDGLRQRGKQVLEEDEAFEILQTKINGLLQSGKLAETACLLIYLLSKPLDRETASTCLALLQKIGSEEDIAREEEAFRQRYG